MSAHTLTVAGVSYYNDNDETAFFQWLDRMECVESYRGEGRDLVLSLARRPGESDMLELLAFYSRYRISMAELLIYETEAMRTWLRDPEKYWHDDLIGHGS